MGLVRHTATTLATALAAALATLCRLAYAAGGGGSGLLGSMLSLLGTGTWNARYMFERPLRDSNKK